MLLKEIAHARAGDKGDTSIIVVIPYQEQDYATVGKTLSVERLAPHFDVAPEQIRVVAAPDLQAYTVVIAGRLDGGVTRSRGDDPHGKALSGHMLDLSILAPESR